LLGRLDGRQDVWLALVIAVGANSKVNLLRVAISLEGFRDT